MAGKDENKEWPYWLAAIVTFLICAVMIWLFLCERPSEGVRVVLLGDSIYAEKREETCVAQRLSKVLGLPVFNGAFGGTSLARSDSQRRMDEKLDDYSLVAFSKSIVSKDFGVQKQVRVEIPATEYFGTVLEELANIYFTKTELLFIGYGMNDYQNGVRLEDERDPWNEYTFGGALRSALKMLGETYPQLRIILLTPTYSWYEDRQKSCEELDFGGGFLEEYVNLELKIGAEYGVSTIDLYHDLYSHESFEDFSKYTRDGIHPNEQGLKLISQRIITYLEEHPR